MKNYHKYLSVAILIVFTILSCAKEKVVEPIRLSNYKKPQTTSSVDTTNNNNNNNNTDTIKTHPCNPDTVYFVNDVLPLLQSKCLSCHNDNNTTEDVSFTSYNSIMSNDELVEPNNYSHSELYEAITETDTDDLMPPPPASALTSTQIDLIKKWIQQGAKNNKCTP